MSTETIANDVLVVKESCIHNRGVFARKHIAKGTRLIEYIGRKVTDAEADIIHARAMEESRDGKSGRTYLFELDERNYIDGDTPENHARYINHSCSPNSEYVYEDSHIWIVSIRDIEEGEEVCYNYGFDLDEEYMEHPCCCGSKDCVGFILHQDHWEKLKEIVSSKA